MLNIVYEKQAVIDQGRVLTLLQIDFSAAFDCVNYPGLFMLRDIVVGGVVLDVIAFFFSGREYRGKEVSQESLHVFLHCDTSLCKLLLGRWSPDLSL